MARASSRSRRGLRKSAGRAWPRSMPPCPDDGPRWLTPATNGDPCALRRGWSKQWQSAAAGLAESWRRLLCRFYSCADPQQHREQSSARTRYEKIWRSMQIAEMQIAIAEQRCAGEGDGHQLSHGQGEGGPADTAEAKGLDGRGRSGGARNRQQIDDAAQQQGLKGEICRTQQCAQKIDIPQQPDQTIISSCSLEPELATQNAGAPYQIEVQQVPPLRFAPVGMTILSQEPLPVPQAELSFRPERSVVEGPAVPQFDMGHPAFVLLHLERNFAPRNVTVTGQNLPAKHVGSFRQPMAGRRQHIGSRLCTGCRFFPPCHPV